MDDDGLKGGVEYIMRGVAFFVCLSLGRIGWVGARH